MKHARLINAVVAFSLVLLSSAESVAEIQCPSTGTWTIPEAENPVAADHLFKDMSQKPIVLLGETHTSAEHHRWQLQTVAALYGHNPNMVVGFEAFPRVVQPVLDQWSKGELNEKEFLEKSRWFDVWKYDPDLYLPLFHFIRMNRVPMRALNVERTLTRQVSKEGWAAIPEADRRGLGNPAPAPAAYLESLRNVFGLHREDTDADWTDQDEAEFKRFIDVQLTWDRAMAEALTSARIADGAPLVIGIIGRGHLEYGYGVPHQLNDLGISGSAVLLPSDSGPPCAGAPQVAHTTPVADALFGISAPKEADKPEPPLLGVRIENTDYLKTGAVRIIEVLDESVASTAGLQEGDLIVQAAGEKTTETRELVATVRRQAPGTWLPLTVIRNDKQLDIIAKFPAAP